MEGDNMANPEHLAIINKGVDAWNMWRTQNPGIRPDLSESDLSEADLSGAIFMGVMFYGVDLYGAILTDANLSGADLSKADLTEAYLSGADLSEARLRSATLLGADLRDADLSGTHLSHADLSCADLSGADLSGADLMFSHLHDCDLTGATLTGAYLYGAAKEDWIINNIICRHVFMDLEGEIRSPKKRNFASGEFEQIYRTLPIIEYVFKNGMTPMDPLIMDRVVQAIRERNPEYDIQIDSLSARGLAPYIKFTVQKEEQKKAALAEVTRGYEARIHNLAGHLDEARGVIQRLIDRPGSVSIVNATGQYLAIGGSTINIDQHVEYITNLRDAVAALPEDSPTFAKVAKNTAMDLIGIALKDVAKGHIKEAAKQIYELGKDLGPVVASTAAYGFFRSYLGL